MAVAGVLADSRWGWPSIFYVSGGIAILWALVYCYVGANNPQDSRTISEAERKYILSTLPSSSTDRSVSFLILSYMWDHKPMLLCQGKTSYKHLEFAKFTPKKHPFLKEITYTHFFFKLSDTLKWIASEITWKQLGEKHPQVSLKCFILFKDIWQHLKVHTTLFLSMYTRVTEPRDLICDVILVIYNFLDACMIIFISQSLVSFCTLSRVFSGKCVRQKLVVFS